MKTSHEVDPHSHQHHHKGHTDQFQNDYPEAPPRPTREQLKHINGWVPTWTARTAPACRWNARRRASFPSPPAR
jgi:hypothetical protein